MKIFKGLSIVDGIAIEKIFIYKKNKIHIQKVFIDNLEIELNRLEQAKQDVIKELQQSYSYALDSLSGEDAMIFKVQEALLEDDNYLPEVIHLIKLNKINSEYAIKKITDKITKEFSQVDDAYLRERCTDVKEVSKKLIASLNNQDDDIIKITEPCILVADDILATDVLYFDRNLVKGIILRKGTKNSHTSILIKNKNIPCVINAEDLLLSDDLINKRVIINNGSIFLEPDDMFTSRMIEKQSIQNEKEQYYKKFINTKDITKDGKNIKLYCNIGNVNDITDVLSVNANGIGLFRSEFIFMNKASCPTEDEQFEIYKNIALKMGDKKFIIRTMDIGSDKTVDYLNLEKEENPALGYRAIRICLEQKEIFKSQLKAIYRASIYGNISIMFPMIINEEEIIEIIEIVDSVKKELAMKNIEFKDIELGIMIETPSAVIISDILAKYVDFFSIGSNDLTQYTLAIDRQNILLNAKYNLKSKSILRMINTVIENGHKEGIWVGMCGELASDIELIDTFLAMGIDELSVVPNMVLKIREKIVNFESSKVKDLGI